jgi:hypothetical protein
LIPAGAGRATLDHDDGTGAEAAVAAAFERALLGG